MIFRFSLAVALASVVAPLAACSSTSSTSDKPATAPGADAASQSTTSCSTMSGAKFDDSASCFDPATTLTGLCFTRPPPPNTLGLENVCVVSPAGVLYVVTVETDTSLQGPGWTIGGGRTAPDAVAATDTPLSAADAARCGKAQGIPATRACTMDAGSTD